MIKKLLAGFCVAAVLLAGCNKSIIDYQYKFDVAIIEMPGGTVERIDIATWNDYEGEQIQVIAKDGTVYLVSSVNCVLMKEV